MGCCASRDKPTDSKDNKPPHAEKDNIVSEAQKLNIRPIEENLDIQSYDLLKYIEELNSTASWNTIKEDSWFSVKSIRGTKFDQVSPVTRAWLHLDERIPLTKLLDVLLLPEKRKEWDEVTTLEIFDGNFPSLFYLYQSVMLLGFKNDYVTKNLVKTSDDSVVAISYNVENEKKPIEKGFNRGVIHFNVIMVTLVNNRTEITVYNQTDPKNKLGKMSADKKIESLDKWCLKLKTAIMKEVGKQTKLQDNANEDTMIEEEPNKAEQVIKT
ncbi:unnamed protein product [Blepharisma stoltei]|uniref:START domain-containing protein n=1 Tax=Blepharisma stoltei TaxID=1481888 RepID=A0AAU9IU14_9CILI|nr:unnamed protein product [Blepharisma stoltei]